MNWLTSLDEPPITWIDIARSLAQLDPASPLWASRPAFLTRATIDWINATFEYEGEERPVSLLLDWLEKVFPQRLETVGGAPSFILDGPDNHGRLPIEWVKTTAEEPKFSVSLGAIDTSIAFKVPKSQVVSGLPVIACHSVKGGNGRTTTAIACAMTWAERARAPILIIDADLEAPGLSYLFTRNLGPAQIGFEDVVCLAHGDCTRDFTQTISFVSDRLHGQKMDNLFILPLRRNLSELTSSSIRAEHISSEEHPFALTYIIRSIAEAIGCAGVVVDLRAGLTPIAAQLILDPSVGRIFVSSMAGQSLEGTVSLFKYISREARRRELKFDPPLLVINRVPSILIETGSDETIIRPALEEITVDLLRGQSANIGVDDVVFPQDDDVQPLAILKIPEVADLQATSSNWDGLKEQLRTSGFLERFANGTTEWLDRYFTPSEPSIEAAKSTVSSYLSERDELRNLLGSFAGQLVAAEVAEQPIENPLVTGPLRALAEQFITQMPIVISEGAKGTGKTLTARFLVAQKTWAACVLAIADTKVMIDAMILPVLGSIQSSGIFQAEIDAQRRAVASSLGFADPQPVYDTKRYLSDRLNKAESDEERAAIWMNAIAWSAGFSVQDGNAGIHLAKALRDKGKNLLAVIEGVEELYVNPFAGTTPQWLRSLVVDLPQRLRGEPSRPLGILAFVRRDSVDAAIPQNSDQFRRIYRSFALTWSDGDVLELAAWLSTKAQALDIWTPKFRELPNIERERLLFPLWGRKLGPDDRPSKRTAEAYTANWIIAVLSDLQSRLVARDLIRLMENAAGFSIGPADADIAMSRLLTPRALKDAVKPTSVAKVQETQEEIAELKPVFDKFRRLPDRVVAPLDEAAIETLSLSNNDIELLQRHGILFRRSRSLRGSRAISHGPEPKARRGASQCNKLAPSSATAAGSPGIETTGLRSAR